MQSGGHPEARGAAAGGQPVRPQRPSLSYFKVQERHSGAGLGTLTPTCFSTLQATFDKFDEDASGTMNSCELRLALTAAGMAGDLG